MKTGPSQEGRAQVLGALGEGIRIAFARLHVFLPIALALRVGLPAAYVLWKHFSGTPDPTTALRFSVLVGVTSVLMPPLLTSALLAKANLRRRRREPVRMGSSLAAGIRSLLVPVAIGVTLTLAITAILRLMASLNPIEHMALIVFGTIGGFLGFLLAVARFGIAAAAAADERLSIRAAIRRSWQLTQGRTWRIAGLIFVLILVWMILFRGFFSVLLNLYVLRRALESESLEPFFVRIEITNAAVDTVAGTFVAVIAVTLFARLREQRDGLSIEELEKAFD